MNITKKDLSRNISSKLGIKYKNANLFINYFVNTIKINLIKNKNVKISGFGSYSIKSTQKRIGRNPKTKESYIISPRKVVKFNASKKIRENLNWNL